MGTTKKQLFWRIVLPLALWSVIALLALMYPVPREPEGLPPEAWSYYSSQQPVMNFLLYYRNELLILFFAFAIIPEIFYLFFARKKEIRQ